MLGIPIVETVGHLMHEILTAETLMRISKDQTSNKIFINRGRLMDDPQTKDLQICAQLIKCPEILIKNGPRDQIKRAAAGLDPEKRIKKLVKVREV